MATTSTPQGSLGNLTLEQWIEFALKNTLNDELIYSYLSPPLPANSVSRWLARIDRIEKAARPKGVSRAAWSRERTG